jgi:hypothetical protein
MKEREWTLIETNGWIWSLNLVPSNGNKKEREKLPLFEISLALIRVRN